MLQMPSARAHRANIVEFDQSLGDSCSSTVNTNRRQVSLSLSITPLHLVRRVFRQRSSVRRMEWVTRVCRRPHSNDAILACRLFALKVPPFLHSHSSTFLSRSPQRAILPPKLSPQSICPFDPRFSRIEASDTMQPVPSTGMQRQVSVQLADVDISGADVPGDVFSLADIQATLPQLATGITSWSSTMETAFGAQNLADDILSDSDGPGGCEKKSDTQMQKQTKAHTK